MQLINYIYGMEKNNWEFEIKFSSLKKGGIFLDTQYLNLISSWEQYLLSVQVYLSIF